MNRWMALCAACVMWSGCAGEDGPAGPDAPEAQAIAKQELGSLATLSGAWTEVDYALWEPASATPLQRVTAAYCEKVGEALGDACGQLPGACKAQTAWFVIAGTARCAARLELTGTGWGLPELLRIDLQGAPGDLPRCGDGTQDDGEACDDGNTAAGDGCSNLCNVELCGNAIVDPGEGCDDGNALDGDGCTAECIVEPCGNGVLEGGEGCDDGNTTAGDGCSSACQPEACGNGVIDAGEECDDGNTDVADGCGPTCHWEVCGNGIVDWFEECDGTDGCTFQCSDGVCSQPMDGDGMPVCLWTNDITNVCDMDCLEGEGFWGGCETIIEKAFSGRKIARVDALTWSRLRSHTMIHEHAVALQPVTEELCAAAWPAADIACSGIVQAMPEADACSSQVAFHGGACTVRLSVSFSRNNPTLGVHTTELPGVLQFTVR